MLKNSAHAKLSKSPRKLKDELVRDKPVNLNLFTIAFPVTAVASILHRISGIILFILIPYLLYVLQNIVAGTEIFMPFNKFILWIIFVPFIYHVLAGVRHVIMDLGYGEEKNIARTSALVVFVFTALISILLGYYLC